MNNQEDNCRIRIVYLVLFQAPFTLSLSIILLVEDTFDHDDDDADDEDDQNVGTMRMMMMGIAVLQGRLLAAAGSENNSLHLLMSADHRFIILLLSGYRDVYH